MIPPLDDEILVRELVARAGTEGREGLLAFCTLVSARQYAPIYRRFRGSVPAAARVLDWGAGSGHFTHFLWRAGYRATAFAFATPALAAVWGEGGPQSVTGDPGEPVALPFADRAFDAACSIGVLEHVHESGGDEAASLRELVRVLTPGGVFFCCHLPCRTSWVEWAARRTPAGCLHHHARRFTAGEARRVLHAAGLEVEHVQHYGFLPRNGWSRAPRLAASHLVADLYDGLDAILARALPWLCTNLLVVARKRPDAGRAA